MRDSEDRLCSCVYVCVCVCVRACVRADREEVEEECVERCAINRTRMGVCQVVCDIYVLD